jgi:hypothetical protein
MLLNITVWPTVEAHTYNSNTWEVTAEGSEVQGHPGLQYSETLFPKKKKRKENASLIT